MSQRTITINGRQYDAHTGMPIADVAPEPVKKEPQAAESSKKTSVSHAVHPSHSVHKATQKSQTLNRRIVQKSQPTMAPAEKPTIRRSAAITKFAPHPAGVTPRSMSDIGPRQHPMVAKAHAQTTKTPSKNQTPKPSKVIKNEAIQHALKNAPSKKEIEKKHSKKQRSRFFSVASASLALLLLGGYFTYLNMPGLSVRVAAAQAGIEASYPEYRPDGYGLKGPVAYGQGQVSMKFAANSGPQNYTIDQSKSSWDSSAVLDNYVKKKAGDNYITYNERGLTIYTFDGNAAWVNGGILYTISGDAPLSSDQIRRIATSM